MASDDFTKLKSVCESLIFELVEKQKNYVLAVSNPPSLNYDNDGKYSFYIVPDVDANDLEAELLKFEPTCQFELIRGDVVPVIFDNLKLRVDDPFLEPAGSLRAPGFDKWAARRLLSQT